MNPPSATNSWNNKCPLCFMEQIHTVLILFWNWAQQQVRCLYTFPQHPSCSISARGKLPMRLVAKWGYALTQYLCLLINLFLLCISDINDGGEVEENIYHNFSLNGLTRVPHIPHTWGTGDSQHSDIMSDDILKHIMPCPVL